MLAKKLSIQLLSYGQPALLMLNKADNHTVWDWNMSNHARHPRFQDALMGIAEIYEILGEYAHAAETYDRILDLLENEWGLTEETDSPVTVARKEKARLLAMV